MNQPLFQQLHQLAVERWVRQGIRTLLRGLWLAACVWCIGLGGHLAWGWPLRIPMLTVLSLGIIGASLILLLRPRLSPREVARRLDRRFHLDEQLTTAVELGRSTPESTSVAAQLLARSGKTVEQVRRRIARQQTAPWSEVIALVALLLVLGGLAIMLGISRFGAGLVGTALAPLPGLATPSQQTAEQEPFTEPDGGPQSSAPSGQQATNQGGDPQVLGPIADALRDQGATRPAADALDQGDQAGAAESLRELADQAGQLSAGARRDLANNLDEAANQIEERDPALAEQLRDSADGLNQGGNQASQALEDLASAIEQLGAPSNQAGEQNQAGQPSESQSEQGQQGQQGESGEQGGDQQGSGSGTGNSPAGEQRQSAPSSRLGVEGEPVELEAEGDSTNAEGGSDKQPSTAEVVPGQVSGGGQSAGQEGDIGADPLRVPADERSVVQDYFTP